MARRNFKREQQNPDPISGPPVNNEDHLVSSGDTIAMDIDEETADGIVHDPRYAKTANATIPQFVTTTLNGCREGSPQIPIPASSQGLQVLGQGVKELVQAVQNLRHLGIEKLVLPLPKIVVVGDQSTGKSSLIEGMSEIKVPRSAGTCTRCPLEINLTESARSDDQWSCQVFLVRKYIYDGSLGKKAVLSAAAQKTEGATTRNPLGPWTSAYPEDLPFASLKSKDDVVDALERAQLATLNPSSSYEKYKPGNPIIGSRKSYQVKFSPNIIRLDITGPGLPNLSFYDLPGVINVSEVPEEAYLVKLVRNLVKDYIKAEDCINLLALTMTDDIANSSALSLVKEVKAETRTVGCLTKPDRMQEGESIDQWIQILNGERFQLGFGYHVIKNNPDAQIDHNTAREEEGVFFKDNEPWATTLHAHKERFGTIMLQSALSERLTTQIRRSLPRIIDQVQQKADYIEARLGELPEPLGGNLPAVIMGELLRFEQEIHKHIEGVAQANLFQKDWNRQALAFRKVLADSRPTLIFPSPPPCSQRGTLRIDKTPTPSPSGSKNTPIYDLDSDSDETADSKTSPVRLGSKRPHGSSQSTPSKISKIGPCSTSDSIRSRCFKIEEVRSIIQDAYVGLPGQIDPKATERMIKMSMEHWNAPVNQFLMSTRILCQDLIADQVHKVFGHRQHTLYYDTILEICRIFFEGAYAAQHKIAEQILGWEQLKPSTLNDEAMNVACEKARHMIRAHRHSTQARIFVEEQEKKVGRSTEGQARADKIAKITESQLPPEPYLLEIAAMSTVKGYYECAYSRFVDTLCASIQCGLFVQCRVEIVSIMQDRFAVLEPDADERCARLLAANPVHEETRAILRKEKDTIAKAQEELRGLSLADVYE